MGGLKSRMPTTYWTFVVATLALAGVPPLAGFFSKDEILAKVFGAGAGNLNGYGTAYLVLWGFGLAGAFVTAFYMFRAVHMTFHGEFRGGHEAEHHLHESPRSMTVPLQVLAAGSAVLGVLGMGMLGAEHNWFEGLLRSVAAPVEMEGYRTSAGVEWLLIALSVGVALAGIAMATRWYSGPEAFARPARFAERFPTLVRTVANKYYVDEAYDRAIVRPLASVARFSWKGIDTVAIDGTLNASAFFTEIAGDLLRFLQTGNVRNYGLLVLAGALAAAAWLLH